MTRTPEATFRLLLDRIRDYLAGYPDRYDVHTIPALTVHHTDDPDTVVVEFSAQGRTVATGEPYRLDYVTVITTADGLITEFRDHWSPVAVASAAGTLPELIDALGADALGVGR